MSKTSVPSFSLRRSSASNKPVPKAPPQIKGLFGQKGDFGKFKQMQFAARKMQGRYVPSSGGKLYEKETKQSLQRLEGYSKQFFRKNLKGLTPKQLGSINDPYSIVGKLYRQELPKAKRENRWKEAKLLERDIKIYTHLQDKGF